MALSLSATSASALISVGIGSLLRQDVLCQLDVDMDVILQLLTDNSTQVHGYTVL